MAARVHDPERALHLWVTLALEVCETKANDETPDRVQEPVYINELTWMYLIEDIIDADIFIILATVEPVGNIVWAAHSGLRILLYDPASLGSARTILFCLFAEGRVPAVMWYARCSASTPVPAPMLTTHCMTGDSKFLTAVGFYQVF